jgi:cobaltochelatase CobS
MSKKNEVCNVTVNSTAFGFTQGEYYQGQKVAGGWKIKNEDGDDIVLPDNMVTVQTQPIQQTLLKAAPVGQKMSKEEEDALTLALSVQGQATSIASQKQIPTPESPGILAQILNGEEASTGGIPHITPTNLADMSLTEDLRRVHELLKPPATPLLEEGQCWLSDLTEGVLPSSGMDYRITTYAWNHFPEHLRQDIPDYDIFHEWDPNVLEDIHLTHTENLKGLLVGGPGSGKSTSYQNYAGLILHPFMKLNGKSGIDASTFLGFLWANASGTEFSEGLLPVAMRHGYMLCIDEVFKIPADIQMNFQTVYEESGFLLLDEKPGTLHDKLIKPHPDFRLFATDNAKGTGDNFDKFGATQVQDTSTLDRFGLTTDTPYLPQKKEVKALCRLFPKLEDDVIARFVRTANMIREAYWKSDVSLTLSMRGLKVMCRLYVRGISEAVAFKKGYLAKLSEEDEIDVCNGFASTVGLSEDSPLMSPAQVPKSEEPAAPKPWDKRSSKSSDIPFHTPI